MKVLKILTGEAACLAAQVKPPIGPGFDLDIVLKTEVLVLYGTELHEFDEEFIEWKARDCNGELVGRLRLMGH